MTKYIRKGMKGNIVFTGTNTTEPKFLYVRGDHIEEFVYTYIVVCKNCKQPFYKYKDGVHLRSVEITHCNITETVYIAEEMEL